MSTSRLKKSLKKGLLRPIAEKLGIPRWTRKPAAYDLDNKLSVYLNFRNGVFVEAGGNNGISQSNTFFLEKGLKWKGILVEAIPELYEKCRKIRTRSTVVHGGLVSNTYDKPTLKMHYAGLMSATADSMKAEALEEHIQAGLSCQKIAESYCIDVPAVTFENILEENHITKIDFLSIDLEGYEIEALKGWNFTKHRPRYILIEVRDLKQVDEFLEVRSYARIDQFTCHDYLFRDKLS